MTEFLPCAVLLLASTALQWRPLGLNDPWDPEAISEDLVGPALAEPQGELKVVFGRCPRPTASETDGKGQPEGFEQLDSPELIRLGEVTTQALERKLSKIRAFARPQS